MRWLGSQVGAFLSANPGWAIRGDAKQDFTAFDTKDVAFGLRYGHGEWAGLSVTRVMHDLIMPMCSPDYLARLRAIQDDPVSQLRHAALIASVKAQFRWDLWRS